MFYSYSNRPPRRQYFNDMPSMTVQDCAESCDINNLINRLRPDGSLVGESRIPTGRPLSGDFSDLPSYQEAIIRVADAQERFASLPAVIRDRFENDPAKLLEFVGNSANKDEAIKLGLIDVPAVPPEPAPVKVKVVTE